MGKEESDRQVEALWYYSEIELSSKRLMDPTDKEDKIRTHEEVETNKRVYHSLLKKMDKFELASHKERIYLLYRSEAEEY